MIDFDDLIEESWNSIDVDTINTLETSNNITLPAEYRNFLLAVNGGRPSHDNAFVFVEGQVEPLCDIKNFFGILPDGPECADLMTVHEWYSDRLPKNMLPIATDSCGNVILLDVQRRPGIGGVYFWVHDSEVEGTKEDGLTRVSASFQSFLDQTGDWSLPEHPAWLKAIERKSGPSVIDMIDEGLSPHVTYNSRSIIEYAAIHAQEKLVERLIAEGVELEKAFALAVQNAEFFPEHKSTVLLLKRAISERGGDED